MKDFGMDFGLLIAYFAPGSLALWGSTFWVPELGDIVSRQQSSAPAFASLVIAALMLGMLLSVVRASTVDRTFAMSMQWVPFSAGTALARSSGGPSEPDYAVLCKKEVLDAYLEAKASNKRPYQFYGNTMLALVLCTGGYLKWNLVGAAPWTLRETALLLLTLIACHFLYLAARNSHQKFVKAVAEINKWRVSET